MSAASIFSQELIDTICERLAEGESLRSICKSDGMPKKSTVFRWLAANAEFRVLYELACEMRADTYADEIVDIADDGSRDYKPSGEDGAMVVDYDHISRARLRVDARKWIACKLKPKKYSDRIDLTHGNPDGSPMVFQIVNYADPNSLPIHPEALPSPGPSGARSGS